MSQIERVLIVDDNAANVLFFEMILQELGIRDAFKTTTGDDGIELVKKHHIQMIIVAWELKGMPGTTFIQRARRARKRRHLPCLIYSKRMTDDDVKLTRDLGFNDILSLPFDKSLAIAKLKAMKEREETLPQTEQTIRHIEAYLNDSKPSEALKLLNNKIYESPYEARSHALTADIWLRLQKFDKAETHLDAALKIDAHFMPALHVKAKLLTKTGKHQEAIDLLEKLTQGSPRNLQTRMKLGSALMEASRDQEAKQVLNTVLDIDPDCQTAKDTLAAIAVKEGDMSLAEQLIAETENGDELASTLNSIAIAQIATTAFDKGIQTYTNALRLLADKARVYLLHYNLGLGYRKKGDLAKAFEHLALSYTQNPAYEKAYASIVRLVEEMKQKGTAIDNNLVKQVKSARKAEQSKKQGVA